jgi:hypothetical protein
MYQHALIATNAAPRNASFPGARIAATSLFEGFHPCGNQTDLRQPLHHCAGQYHRRLAGHDSAQATRNGRSKT